MYSRIAPSSFPKHIVEIGFLNDLIANLSLKQAGLEYDASVFQAERLAAWDYEHRRELARCTGKLFFHSHIEGLSTCDTFVDLLKGQRWQEAEAQLVAVRKAINEFSKCTLEDNIKY